MLQETPDDGRHLDVVADALHAGAQAADAAHLEPDAHALHGSPVQGPDNVFIHQLVAFENDFAVSILLVQGRFALDHIQQGAAHGQRGDEQFPVLLAVGVSGHDIEEIGDVRADVRVGSPMSVYILAVEGL